MVNPILRYPRWTLIALSGICLLAFLATVPLPRVDGQLVGSDGIGYYAYLPSVWFDGDLDFTDEYIYFYAFEPGKAEEIIDNATPRGVPPNQWPIGPAILWTPLFLLAHLLANFLNLLGAGISTDGYGYFYQAFVLSGSILYGGASLWFTYGFVRELAAEKAALVATVLVAFGGNLVYYMTAEPSMAHAPSAFASGLFFHTWVRRRNRPGVKTALLYGLLGGLMALVRPQDGLFLALPFLAELPDVWRSLHRPGATGTYRRWLRDGLVAGLAALVTFSPQMVAWHQIYGSPFRSPYMYGAGPKFYWLSPRLGAVLFSAWRGLFVWHPVFLLALLGLLLTCRKEPVFGCLGLLGLALQWYLISSWHLWYQGEAFGGRMFIGCTPVFALGLAHLIEWVADVVRRRWSWSVVYVVGGLLLACNFLLFVEYRFDLATARRPPTWHDLTVRRVTFLIELTRHVWR